MKYLAWFLTLVAMVPQIAIASITVRGSVRGADGTAPPLCHVHLMPFEGGYPMAIQSVETRPDGAFLMNIGGAGNHELTVSGVNHNPMTIPLVGISAGDTVSIDVTLAPLDYLAEIPRLGVIGDWQGWDFENAPEMVKQPDGTFTLEVEAVTDTLAYEVIGLIAGRAVNGTQSDYYSYDGGGDYHSILRVKPGPVTLRVDPRKLSRIPSSNLPRLVADPRHGGIVEVAAIWKAFRAYQYDFSRAIMAHEQADGKPEDFRFAGSPAEQDLKSAFDRATDPQAREIGAAALVVVATMGKAPAAGQPEIAPLIHAIPPESPVWGIRSFGSLRYIAGRQREPSAQHAFLEDILEKNPDRNAKVTALISLFYEANAAGDSVQARRYYSTIKSDYSDLQDETRHVLIEFDPDRAIQAGRQVPDFDVTLMGTEGHASRTSLLGKYYLIDFWATWCGPCVGELPVMHEAWERFSPKGLVVLSLSLDRSPADVDKFRRGTWSMPWQHAFLENGFQNPMAATFEVTGIPKPILVGPAGEIIATGNSLRGVNLAQTLELHLASSR